MPEGDGRTEQIMIAKAGLKTRSHVRAKGGPKTALYTFAGAGLKTGGYFPVTIRSRRLTGS